MEVESCCILRNRSEEEKERRRGRKAWKKKWRVKSYLILNRPALSPLRYSL